MSQTAVYMTDEEAEQFKLFCQYQPIFTTLINTGVFGIKNGSAILSFNHTGLLADIEIKYKAYHLSKLDSLTIVALK